MYINTGQVSKENKDKRIPDSLLPSSPTRRKKKKQRTWRKKKAQRKKPIREAFHRIDWFDFSFFDLYTCLLPTERSITKHLLSYPYSTGLYNLICSFLFLFFLPLLAVYFRFARFARSSISILTFSFPSSFKLLAILSIHRFFVLK